MKTPQYELPVAGGVFNLAPEHGVDGAKAIAEMAEAMKRQREAKEYADKMQRQLAECPGFTGVDVSPSPEVPSRVALDARLVGEAMLWLKRRFKVAENLELSEGDTLLVEVAPRAKARSNGRRIRFGKIEQFALPI